MILIVTPHTVIQELTQQTRAQLARAMGIPPSMVTIQWRANEAGDRLEPVLDIQLPPAIPPSTLDVSDPEQMAAWNEEVASMPQLDEFLKAKGVDDPKATTTVYMHLLVRTVAERLRALG